MRWAGPRVRKLLALRRADWIALAQAFCFLLLMPVGLRLTSLKALLDGLAGHRPLSERAKRQSLDADRVAYFVEVAARYQPSRPTCLTKALATCAILRWQGAGATLIIGARHREGTLQAHAWVEHAGAVVGEPDRDGWLALGGLGRSAGGGRTPAGRRRGRERIGDSVVE